MIFKVAIQQAMDREGKTESKGGTEKEEGLEMRAGLEVWFPDHLVVLLVAGLFLSYLKH